jgi:hypothetical protein
MNGILLTTRKSSWSGLNPGLQRVFRGYFESHGLENPAAGNFLCCETRTDRSGLGSLAAFLDGNPPAVEHLGIMLTDKSLIWARAREPYPPIAVGADLKEIRVRPYTSLLSKESGLELSGLVGDKKAGIRGRFALGPEPAAMEFIDAVIQAVGKANPPAPKKEIPWLKWFSRKEK